MESNLRNILNERKIKTGSSLSLSVGKPIPEEKLPLNDDATTVYGGNRPPQQKTLRDKNPFREEEIGDLSDDEPDDTTSEFEVKKKKFKEVHYPENDFQEKYKYIQKFKKYKKRGYRDIQIPEMDDGIDTFKAIDDNLRYIIKKEKSIKVLRYILWFMSLLFETVVKNIGYGTRFDGFASYIWDRIDDYEEYLDDMVADTFRVDETTGRVVRIKNTSIVTKLDVNPTFNLFITWVKDAIQFSAINNASLFSNVFKGKKITEEDEDQLLDEIPIPDPDENE